MFGMLAFELVGIVEGLAGINNLAVIGIGTGLGMALPIMYPKFFSLP